jgi:hypothetical protein
LYWDKSGIRTTQPFEELAGEISEPGPEELEQHNQYNNQKT